MGDEIIIVVDNGRVETVHISGYTDPQPEVSVYYRDEMEKEEIDDMEADITSPKYQEIF